MEFFFFWTGLATLAVWLFVWNESHHRKARRQDEARRRRMEADYQQHKRRAAEIWNAREACGLPEILGVWNHEGAPATRFTAAGQDQLTVTVAGTTSEPVTFTLA